VKPAWRPEFTARWATNTTNSKPIRASSNTWAEMIDHGYVNDGQNVWAMQANGTFASVNGTSFSTPLWSGTIANIVSQDTSRTNIDVRSILDEWVKDLWTAGPDQIYGKWWARTWVSLKNATVRHIPNSFNATTTPTYNFVPKYYNRVETTNEKIYINWSVTGITPTVINGQNQAEFLLSFVGPTFVNGSNTIRYEFNTPDGCVTSIYKTFTLSNVWTPTVPPIPTIINVDPTECQSNPTQVGKLMNPPVSPATIAVTQDGNPLPYNATDSTFQYPVGTPWAHTIRAKYTNTAGSSQKDTAYNVTAAITPTAALPTVNNANICTGQTATFTANATNVGANPTYKWYINNLLQAGTASTFTTPVFATAGTYQVKYELTPTTGWCYTNSAPVTSGNTALNVSQSASPQSDVWPNAVAQCENTAASLSFAFGSNNWVPYTHEQYIINPSGVDNVNGIVVPGTITTPILWPGVWKSYVKSTQGTNTCAPFTVFSDTAVITVNAQFIADATITGPGQVCDNAAINGIATPKVGTPNNTVFKFYKQVGTGTPTLFQTTTYTGTPIAYNTTGQIPQVKVWTVIELPVWACYTNANGDTTTVNVNAIPSAPTATINQPTCSLPTGQITINPVAGSTYSFDNWTTYGTNNVSGQLASGTYQLKIKSTSWCESVATPAVVNIAPATPSASITTITQPSCTVSTGQITVTPVTWYTYSFDNWVTYSTNNVSAQLASGTYQVKVKNAAWCISPAVVAVVSASPLPLAPTITQVSNTLSIQSPIAWASYQWQKKNTLGVWENIGAPGTSYTVTATGEYRTTITNNGCGPVASNAINVVITAIPNPNTGNGAIRIYPNPLQNWQKLTIDSLPQLATEVKIGIYDSKWARVFLMDAKVANKKVEINLPFLSGGIYFIRVQDKANGKRYEGGEKIFIK
jgi:Secretion system C-terminal sorting domain